MPPAPKVVVVDDDDVNREVVVQLAKQTLPRAEIAGIPNGRDALDCIKAKGADLVITDYHMEGMDGADLVRELRAIEPDTPVIMVSANPEARQVGLAAGISRFVDKINLTTALPGAILALLESRLGRQ